MAATAAAAAAGAAVAAADPSAAVLAPVDRRQSPLWERLRAFDFDADSDTDPASDLAPPALSFTARLARDNGWRRSFAARVVDEYRRFLFLASTAGHPVTPSEAIDQAWHLHLVYTRSYWERLCRDVLRRALHHGPTRGGEAEGARYDAQYRATLSSYRRRFGAAPPVDIWPPPAVRFGPDLRWRVWTTGAWIVPKQPIAILAAATAVLVALAAFIR